MTQNNDKDLISKNRKWVKESEKIRTTQLAFDFQSDIDTAVRLAAARRHVPPSAIVREKLGLSTAKPSRMRISVSLNEDELTDLGQRYGIDPSDKAQIKKRISQEISAQFNDDGAEYTESELVKAQEKLAKIKAESERIASSLKGLFDDGEKIKKQ